MVIPPSTDIGCNNPKNDKKSQVHASKHFCLLINQSFTGLTGYKLLLELQYVNLLEVVSSAVTERMLLNHQDVPLCDGEFKLQQDLKTFMNWDLHHLRKYHLRTNVFKSSCNHLHN